MSKHATISIKSMKRKINDILLKSTCSPEKRWGIIMFIEDLLMETGNYNGYGYLTKGEMMPGSLPGISLDSEGKNIFPDETRRYYY